MFRQELAVQGNNNIWIKEFVYNVYNIFISKAKGTQARDE